MGWNDKKEMELRVDIEVLLHSNVSEKLKVPNELYLVQSSQDVGLPWRDCIKMLMHTL